MLQLISMFIFLDNSIVITGWGDLDTEYIDEVEVYDQAFCHSRCHEVIGWYNFAFSSLSHIQIGNCWKTRPLPCSLSLWIQVSIFLCAMAESKTKLESLREWVVDHKLRTVGKFLFIYFLIFHPSMSNFLYVLTAF